MLDALISYFEKFVSGTDRSIQWAKDAETLLDDIEEWDELVDDLQERLSLYRPEGGAHLINEAAMEMVVRRSLDRMRAYKFV